MAMSAAEAQRLIDAAREADVLALIDHELRFLSSRRKLRAMLHSGAIGTVRHCNYVFRSDYRGVLGNWDWWSDETLGGGTLGAIGSHAVDSFRWLLDTEVSEVCGLLSTHVSREAGQSQRQQCGASLPTTTSSCCSVLPTRRLTIKCHRSGNTFGGRVRTTHDNKLEVYGSSGALMVEEGGALWHSPAGSGAWRPVAVVQDLVAPGMRDGSWSRGFTDFFRSDRGRAQSGTKTVEGAATFADGHQRATCA